MSSVLTFNSRAQLFPKEGYKNKLNVFNEGVPVWSRPAVNGLSLIHI